MDLLERIRINFYDSIEVKNRAVQTLLPTILAAGKFLAQCLRSGNKILSCGNGGSASDAMHFTTEIANRFQIERDGLAAISLVSDVAVLTAAANDYGYQSVFARQIQALGKSGDVLLALSTSGNSQNVIEAIRKAHECGMGVVALTGNAGGVMANFLGPADVEIRVPAKTTPRIQETHILIIHCLCDLIDRLLYEDKFSEEKI